jgi:hypothetical protein
LREPLPEVVGNTRGAGGGVGGIAARFHLAAASVDSAWS